MCKLNRSGIKFICKHCDYTSHADLVGSINIARRASSEHKLNPATRMIHTERDARLL